MISKNIKKLFEQKNNESFNLYTLKLTLPTNLMYSVIISSCTVLLLSYSTDAVKSGLTAAALLILIFETMILPLIHSILTKKISRMLFYYDLGTFDTDDKRQLLNQIIRYPVYKAVETFIHFVIFSLVLSFIFFAMLHLDIKAFIYVLIFQFLSSYFVAVINYNTAETICSEKAMLILKDGILPKSNKNYLGLSLRALFAAYILIPLVICSTSIFIIIILGNTNLIFHRNGSLIARNLSRLEMSGTFSIGKIEFANLAKRLIVLTLANISVIAILSLLYFRMIKKYTLIMQEGLKSINTSKIENAKDLPVDMSSELSYTTSLINKTMHLFSSLMDKTAKINSKVEEASQNLAAIAEESKSTAITQSAGAKEIVSTMQFANEQAHKIEVKIQEVNNVAAKTTESVNYGFEAIKQNIAKMQEITISNQTTINGIENLSNKIDSIWDIVKLIDSVTDQTKIIAFNAELEAESITESKEKFQNVAYEIRSLTDSVMNLTKNIKEQILMIQKASNELIETGRDCSEKIEDGNNMTLELQKKFNQIRSSALTTSRAAAQIIEKIKIQTDSFKVISDRLLQTSSSIDNFKGATQTISSAVQDLQSGSQHLATLYNKKE